MRESNGYIYLERRTDSDYRQLFVKGKRIRALSLYLETRPDDEGEFRTPQQVAADFDVPVEAVNESILYCESDPVEIKYDRRREDLLIDAHNMNHPDYRLRPQELYRILTAEDRARIKNQLNAEFGPL